MRHLRVLTLAALALAAVLPASAAASSGGVAADSYPATLSGASQGNIVFGAKGYTKSCSGLGFSATLSQSSNSVSSSSVTNPACGGGGFMVYMHGCQIELQPTGSESVNIGPPGCGPIAVPLAPCGGITIPAQDGIAAEYVNHGSGSTKHFTVEIDDSNVKYNEGCLGQGVANNLAITGALKVTAANQAKAQIGTQAYPGGLFLAGGNGDGEPRLDAVEFPVSVVGERLQGSLNGEVTLLDLTKTGNAVKVSCADAAFDAGELTGPVFGGFGLSATYEGCTFRGYQTVVDMNSCVYEYSNLERVQQDEYQGAAAISCDEGDVIEVVVLPGHPASCTITIPAQSLSDPGVVGSGTLDGRGQVVGQFSGSGLKYTASGIACIAHSIYGSKSNGEIRVNPALQGVF